MAKTGRKPRHLQIVRNSLTTKEAEVAARTIRHYEKTTALKMSGSATLVLDEDHLRRTKEWIVQYKCNKCDDYWVYLDFSKSKEARAKKKLGAVFRAGHKSMVSHLTNFHKLDVAPDAYGATVGIGERDDEEFQNDGRGPSAGRAEPSNQMDCSGCKEGAVQLTLRTAATSIQGFESRAMDAQCHGLSVELRAAGMAEGSRSAGDVHLAPLETREAPLEMPDSDLVERLKSELRQRQSQIGMLTTQLQDSQSRVDALNFQLGQFIAENKMLSKRNASLEWVAERLEKHDGESYQRQQHQHQELQPQEALGSNRGGYQNLWQQILEGRPKAATNGLLPPGGGAGGNWGKGPPLKAANGAAARMEVDDNPAELELIHRRSASGGSLDLTKRAAEGKCDDDRSDMETVGLDFRILKRSISMDSPAAAELQPPAEKKNGGHKLAEASSPARTNVDCGGAGGKLREWRMREEESSRRIVDVQGNKQKPMLLIDLNI